MISMARYTKARESYESLMRYYPFDTDSLSGETWCSVENYDGIYQISNFGRVKSFYGINPKIMKPKLSSQGYLYFTLSRNGVTKNCFAHRIMAIAFLKIYEDKAEVNHKDGCKFNNHISNLEWVTRLENTRHAACTGLLKIGEDRANAKLTNSQAAWCRAVYRFRDSEFSEVALAKKFGVSPSAIHYALKGKTYKKVGASR